MRVLGTLSAAALLLTLLPTAAQDKSPPKKIDFAREVQPILKTRCFSCHNPEQRESGLSVATRADLLKGGKGGPALVPGSSRESPIIERITGAAAPVMPFGGEPLTEAQIQTLRDWVDQGAEWPEQAGPIR